MNDRSTPLTQTITEISGGLTPDHELVFPDRPQDPEMRESTSVWLYEENGAFSLPRFGIEAEASSWGNPQYQVNFAFPGGRVLSSKGRGAKPSPFGPEGRPTVLGAGPLSFRCIEPFHKWVTTFDGMAVDGTVDEQIAGRLDPNRLVPVRFEAQLTMVTPCWVQDFTSEHVARMSEADAIEAANMGIGWRLEHLFRGEGTLTIDGQSRAFKAVGSRIKRQSVRPLAGFRGHCWQSAVFPDGRAFGFIAYPPRADGVAYNDGYIYQNGRMVRARAVKIPWLRRIVGQGDDASLELESELGLTRIDGVTAPSTFRVGNPDIGGLNLQQGGVKYTWDGQTTYGMIERSSPAGATSIG
jgi:hypothetical protein